MNRPLLLSRSRIASFLACRRQFQLRVLEKLIWPENPLRAADEERLERGQQFHQLLERYFLGLPIEAAAIPDRHLRNWWLVFEKSRHHLAPGRFLPELTLTIPIGKHLLHGRFDLLIIGEANGEPFTQLVDWKTGRPRSEADLRHDWQTRLYLALLAEGVGALGDEVMGGELMRDGVMAPERMGMTYWYVAEPDAPRTIQYDQAWHDRNWAELQKIVADLEMQLGDDTEWPLTEDWTICRSCVYQVYCGRQEAGTAVMPLDEWDEEPLFAEEPLEPDLP